MAATILHVDADAFFASVEQLLEPRYRGKPLIVGGDVRGVVSSASYEARRYGIHSAMPVYKARKLCPKGIFVKGNHRVYSHFSREMFKIFQMYTPMVEITSIDEAYLDLTGTEDLHQANTAEIAFRILKHVQDKLGITISGGLSTSKMVSKIASSTYKPRRLTCILEGQERSFLAPLPIKTIPGVGPKTAPRLEKIGLNTIGDLANMTFEYMWRLMGGYGIHLWERAQGIDHRPVYPHSHRRKSISEEKTFFMDIDSQDILIQEALKMLKILCFKLRKRNLFAKTVTLKIRYADFETFTHQKTIEAASNREQNFRATLKELLNKNRNHQKEVRLIGVGLSNLQNHHQLNLFDHPESSETPEDSTLQSSLDALREKYGYDII